MIRHPIQSRPDSHYGVSINSYDKLVLLQLQDGIAQQQIRVPLTQTEAAYLIRLLEENIKKLSLHE